MDTVAFIFQDVLKVGDKLYEADITALGCM